MAEGRFSHDWELEIVEACAELLGNFGNHRLKDAAGNALASISKFLQVVRIKKQGARRTQLLVSIVSIQVAQQDMEEQQ